MRAQDLPVAEDEVKFLVEERPVGRERGSVGMRAWDARQRCAHFLGQQGDVAEVDVGTGIGVSVGPVAEQHLVATERAWQADATEEGGWAALEGSR
jgi:hypothetical protein